jgi:hypothetical protein
MRHLDRLERYAELSDAVGKRLNETVEELRILKTY